MQGKAKIIAVNVLIFLIGILFLELYFGNWLFDDKIKNLNIICSQTIKHQLNGLYKSPYDIVVYKRDNYGLRGRHKSIKEIALLTVGGSTTDQRYISEGYTWQDILQDSFEAEGKKIVVANAGVDGQSTYGHIKNFEDWFPHIPDMRPRYILFYVGLNDFHIDEGYGYDRLSRDSEATFISWVRKHSALYRLLQTVHGIYLAEVIKKIGHRKFNFSSIRYTQQALQNDYSFMNKRSAEYRERLTVLIEKTKSFGSTPIIVTQPSRKYRYTNGVLEGTASTEEYDSHTINGIDYYYMKAKLDRVALDVCKSNGIIFFDMGTEMLWDDSDFYDYAHMTPSGARKAGEYLYKKLKSKL